MLRIYSGVSSGANEFPIRFILAKQKSHAWAFGKDSHRTNARNSDLQSQDISTKIYIFLYNYTKMFEVFSISHHL